MNLGGASWGCRVLVNLWSASYKILIVSKSCWTRQSTFHLSNAFTLLLSVPPHPPLSFCLSLSLSRSLFVSLSLSAMHAHTLARSLCLSPDLLGSLTHHFCSFLLPQGSCAAAEPHTSVFFFWVSCPLLALHLSSPRSGSSPKWCYLGFAGVLHL